MFENFVIAGIPLILVVFGIVEACKKFGLSGNMLTVVSLLLGIALCTAYQVATYGAPIGFMGWFEVAITGLMFGLTACGIYDFTASRFPKAG